LINENNINDLKMSRNFFFLNFTIILAFITLSPVSVFCQEVHVLLRGKVADEKGNGLTGIPVTDGINIVQTNTKGEYQLQSTNDAQFVYITIPSGYEIPNDNYIAKFYQKIVPSKGTFKADFTLSKLKQSDRKHYAILWADPQINNQEQANLLHTIAVPDTRKHIEELLKTGPVHGIAAGDISWDAPVIHSEYRKAVQNTGIPFFQVLGNHDMDINTRSDERSDVTFRENFGPSWYSFNRGEAHYVVLDNVFYYADGYSYLGYITEKQLRWLEQDLSKVKPGSLVFVSMHISAYTEEKRRYKRDKDNPGNITFNRKFLFELLKPYRAHLLTGHTHYNENRTEGGVYEHIHGALCAAWWVAPVCDDGTPGGYGVYEIDGTELKWYYKSIGKPKDYQMRVYNKGTYPKRPADIAVNVWNWDKDWKVVWYEDGELKGGMKQETAFDAEAVKYMDGPGNPAKYPWVEPRLTDHIFFATPSVSAKKVTVEVTDRFGNRYREELVM
jgi:hypothetical protein